MKISRFTLHNFYLNMQCDLNSLHNQEVPYITKICFLLYEGQSINGYKYVFFLVLKDNIFVNMMNNVTDVIVAGIN